MTTTLERIEAEALQLPPADRSRLIERLLVSLDVDTEVESAWEALADQRDAETGTGAVQPVALEDALARLEARFPG